MPKWFNVKLTIAEMTEIVEESTLPDSVFNRLRHVLEKAGGDDAHRNYLRERGWHRRDLGNQELWVPPQALWPKNNLFEPLGSALASAVQRQKKQDRVQKEKQHEQHAES